MPDETLDRSSLERLVRALKQARVQRTLSVDEIARLIKIRSTHIEKIEAGDFTFLPPLYVHSYLKKYAAELGVGDDALLDSCRNELGIAASNFSIPPPAQVVLENPRQSAPAPKRKTRRWLIVVAAVVAILFALMLLLFFGHF
ncbi:helix-turn-helix domain-containing protein [Chlorobaculum thiosulfatiphilum]|uniref:Helix-turn-helix domain-containing protein n=1 Tax=Chlorobaculum thiosulfatiphilum TaxID=115852 RepID=A0A5C4S9X1_CHLTI|nr:helix-turn-helix transcriptional regulator [Chlorobaculum thiosulfatiphilum]TNJ40035.1 helix-turn-helix domain-containing protein [Chlorobaculum thiosulfatiphilum]